MTLLARSKLNLAQTEELRITASQLPDVYGRPLDGNDDGQPGGDFVALLTKRGVTISSFATPSTLTAKTVDAHGWRETRGDIGALPQAQGDVSFAKMGLIRHLWP
ncbi:MAG: hypothetical protein ABSH35_16035 [Isosphaeraceae bacterium]